MAAATGFYHSKGYYAVVCVVVVVLIGLAMATTVPEASGEAQGEQGHWYSVVPPLLAIVLAFLSRRLILSLAIGVITGGFLAVLPVQGLGAIGHGAIAGPGYIVASVTDPGNLRILLYIVGVLMMISLIMLCGGFQAIVLWLRRYAKGPYSAKLITALMGVVLFMDDYANTLIIGNTMRPVTDQHRISREKLAFLVDSTSAPIAGLAFISSWIGYEVGLFSDLSQSLEMGKNGYAIFLDALGFRFYCLLLLAFVILHIVLKRDYGPMRTAEIRARTTGELRHAEARLLQNHTAEAQKPHEAARIHAATAILPIVTLAGSLFMLLFLGGNGPEVLAQGHNLFRLSTWQLIVTAIPDATTLLLYASLSGLAVGCVTTLALARVPLSALCRALWGGIKTALLPLSILVMAWSLKQSADALNTGEYIVSVAGHLLQPETFPALIFLVSAVTALTIGTSFGTMGIILPVAIPLAFQLDGGTYGLITVMSMAAVLDGAIFGDHCSPLSDTTIMSSLSSGCDHIHHVKTQLPYAVTVGLTAMLCGYVPVAMGLGNGWGLLLGLGLITVLLLAIGHTIHQDETPEAAT